MPTFFSELEFAARCVAQACRMTPSFGDAGEIWTTTKPDGTRVTEIDLAVQAYAGALLEESFPGDAFVAEEDSSVLLGHADALPAVVKRLASLLPGAASSDVLAWIQRGQGLPDDRFWLMDPIDSTRGLLAGVAFSVQLAGIWDGAVQVAAMGYPRALAKHTAPPLELSGLIFLAARGFGSWWAPLDDPADLRPLRVSARSLKEAVRLRGPTKVPYDKSLPDHAFRDRFSAALESRRELRTPTTVRYPLLALGQGDLYIRLILSSRVNQELYAWDHAAGSLLVDEAGGRVTDLDGRPLDFYAGPVLHRNRGLVASNGVVHEEALEAIRRANDS